MASFTRTFTLQTTEHDAVHDVTDEVARILRESGAREGVCTVFTPHATAAVTINENDDPNIGVDLLRALGKMVPSTTDRRERSVGVRDCTPTDGWLHDRVDNNAAAHIKSAIVGPSVSIPVASGRLALGTWQNVFFCEFDGPRRERKVHVTVVW